MKIVRRVVTAVVFLMAVGLSRMAAADVVDVDCDSLEKIDVAGRDGYDQTICMAGQFSGLGSEYRRPVGGEIEILIAFNRATLVAVRSISTNSRTYLELPSVADHVGPAFAGWEPRNWGEERRYDRFLLANLEARISDESPYLSCVGFMARLRLAPGAPGYRSALSGMYCAVDTLTPTEAEVTTFLDGLKF